MYEMKNIHVLSLSVEPENIPTRFVRSAKTAPFTVSFFFRKIDKAHKLSESTDLFAEGGKWKLTKNAIAAIGVGH